MSTRLPLRLTLRKTFGYATALAAFVVIVVLIWDKGSRAGGVGISDNPREVAIGAAAAIAGYFAGAALAAIAIWGLHPLRRRLLGWVLTGVAVATAVYGAFGLAMVVAYTLAGVNMLEFESRQEAWVLLPPLALVMGVVVGVPGGLLFWFREVYWRHRGASRAT